MRTAAPCFGYQNFSPRMWWHQVVYQTLASSCNEINAKKLDDQYQQLFFELYTTFATKQYWRVFDDVVPFINILKERKLRLAVLSNYDERLPLILRDLNLINYFDFILASGMIGHEKPSKEFFILAEQLANVKKDEILHIGDDVKKDFEGARNMDWDAALLLRNSPYDKNSPFIVPDLLHLLKDY